MNAREKLKRLMAVVVQNASEEDSKLVKGDIDMFLGVSAQLAGILSSRCEALARKRPQNRPKPPKLAPAKPLQTQSSHNSSADTPDSEIDAQHAQKRPDRTSRIQQGIQKAQQSSKSQQQALRRQTYGQQTELKTLQQAAKKLAS